MSLRPAFVLTVAVASTACAPPRGRKVTQVTETGKSFGPLDWRKLKPLNPRIGNDVVYAAGERCIIHVPHEGKMTSWQPPKSKAVDCPAGMDDPAWDHCSGGTISKHLDTAACVCTRDGNPPPPPREVPCPQ